MRHSTLWCLAIIFIGGNLIGVGIGYIPVLLQGYNDATNCTRIGTDENECRWTDDRLCEWNGTTCLFAAQLIENSTCSDITSRRECEDITEWCLWFRPPGSSIDKCTFQQGWQKTETAFVASISTIGGIVGSVLVGIAVTKAGLNNSIALCGISSILAGALLLVGWKSGDDSARLALILTGRFFTGISLGMGSAAIPMYVGDVAVKERSGVLGVGFQVCITFGIMTAALFGYAFNPSQDDLHARECVFALTIYYLVLAVLIVPVSLLADKPIFDDATRNSLLTFRHSAFLRIQPGDSRLPNPADRTDSLFRRPLYVAIAILLAAGQQLGGVNVIMSYVTTMSANIGLENPYFSGFVVMSWNFVSTLFAIWLAYRLTAGTMFLSGELIAALCCFMVAIPIRFFDPHLDVERGFIVTGILVFIFAFEFSCGPVFYVLAQSMFPSEIRSAGCSFTIFCQFVFNGLVTFTYPILVKDFSGGPSKPQDRGLSIMFFIFGAIGVVLTASLWYVMKLIKEDSESGLAHEDEQVKGVFEGESKENFTQY